MRQTLVEHLREPGTGAKLTLRKEKTVEGQIVEGVLESPTTWYPVIDGVPRLLSGTLRQDFEDFRARHGLPKAAAGATAASQHDQAATNTTFSDKWRRFKRYGLEPQHQEFLFGWYCKKLGLKSVADLKAFYKGKKRILECGPGSGFNSRFMSEQSGGEVYALDVSDAAITTYENTRDRPNASVVQADLMMAPFQDGWFDFIIADGVLHHTPDTREAFRALYQKLAPGGQFFFYVYKKMGAARQFCDAHIRSLFSKMAPEECYKACEGLTELGRELSKIKGTITLEKAIPVLGIPAGEHNVQRLLYYNFVKCFWNDAFDYETNNMVNFDWYHPHNAWQHTEEEVRGWLADVGVKEFSIQDANPNGISVLLRKPR